MELKEKIDLLHKIIDSASKQSEIAYKKIFVLISICAGITTIFFKIELNQIWLIILGVVFCLAIIGSFVNYIRLSRLYKEIDNLKQNLMELKNE
jgi:hypothetical protein